MQRTRIIHTVAPYQSPQQRDVLRHGSGASPAPALERSGFSVVKPSASIVEHCQARCKTYTVALDEIETGVYLLTTPGQLFRRIYHGIQCTMTMHVCSGESGKCNIFTTPRYYNASRHAVSVFTSFASVMCSPRRVLSFLDDLDSFAAAMER